MSARFTAQLLATLLRHNTDAHLSGEKSHTEWNAEQLRLWKLAEKRRAAKLVSQLLDPWRVK